jgi:hypothetical protein
VSGIRKPRSIVNLCIFVFEVFSMLARLVVVSGEPHKLFVLL